MRTYWHGMCDDNHSWTVLQDPGDPDPAEPVCCPEGHAAITFSRNPAADVVAVTVDPAARVADGVTSKVLFDHHYFITVTSLVTDEVRRTQRMWLDREVLAVAQRFVGRNRRQAFLLIEQLDADSQG